MLMINIWRFQEIAFDMKNNTYDINSHKTVNRLE